MVELADIIRDVVESGNVNTDAQGWKVVNAIIRCRTSALGGHLYQCTDCNAAQPRYNSCRNRHCPKCQGGSTAKWLEERAKELLPVPYFHLVFTIPHELNELTLRNKKVVYNALFEAVAYSIQKVAKRRYKGNVGFFSILHTWGQKLEAHPHIHCVVPGVVLKKNGSVKKTRQNYFLPRKILAVIFKARLLKLLEKAVDQGKIQGTNIKSLLCLVAKKEWIVYAKKPFASEVVVLKYLSRYTHRIAISNQRISRYSGGKVTFSYRDYKQNGARKSCSLTAQELTRRFLLHVLPHQFVRIRHYGFLANSVRSNALTILRSKLRATVAMLNTKKHPHSCKHCGKEALVLIHTIEPLAFAGSRLRKQKALALVA